MTDTEWPNWWSYGAAKGIRRDTAFVFVSLLALVEGCALLAMVLMGTPAYLVPPGGPGISRPGRVSTVSAIDFAERCLKTRHTFFSSDFREQQSLVEDCFHPAAVKAFQKQVDLEAAVVKQYEMASQLWIKERKVVHREGKAVHVKLEALRAVWVGSDKLREETFQAVVTVAPWSDTEGLKGLALTHLAETPPIAPSGKR